MKTTYLEIGSEGKAMNVIVPPGQKRYANRILRAADGSGTIQAGDAVGLFLEPQHHTTMSLARAFRLAGFTLEEV